MSTLSPEQVDVALALRELAGEPVPVTLAARELWVRHDMRLGMDGRELRQAVQQATPREMGEGDERYKKRLSDVLDELVSIRDIVDNSREILGFLGGGNYTICRARQYAGFDEFWLQVNTRPGGNGSRISIQVTRSQMEPAAIRAMGFDKGDVSLVLYADSPACQELAHLIAPQVRRALEMAPKAFALLELEAPLD